jgi:hypothetical protein
VRVRGGVRKRLLLRACLRHGAVRAIIARKELHQTAVMTRRRTTPRVKYWWVRTPGASRFGCPSLQFATSLPSTTTHPTHPRFSLCRHLMAPRKTSPDLMTFSHSQLSLHNLPLNITITQRVASHSGARKGRPGGGEGGKGGQALITLPGFFQPSW